MIRERNVGGGEGGAYGDAEALTCGVEKALALAGDGAEGFELAAAFTVDNEMGGDLAGEVVGDVAKSAGPGNGVAREARSRRASLSCWRVVADSSWRVLMTAGRCLI